MSTRMRALWLVLQVVVCHACTQELDKAALRSACQIPLSRRTCVPGELPLVDGSPSCRLFDGQREITITADQIQSEALVPSERCEGVGWHVVLPEDPEPVGGDLFLVCRNDRAQACPEVVTLPPRTCRKTDQLAVLDDGPGDGRFLAGIIGGDAGGLVVWGDGAPDPTKPLHARWLGADGLPTGDASITLPGSLLSGVVGGIVVDHAPGRTGTTPSALVPLAGSVLPLALGDPQDVPGAIDIARVGDNGFRELLRLGASPPFGVLDRLGQHDDALESVLEPRALRLALDEWGRAAMVWTQSVVAGEARTDEAYRIITPLPGRGVPQPVGGIRADLASGPAVAVGQQGWGIAFAESYRAGVSGTGFAFVRNDGTVVEGPLFAPFMNPTRQLAIAYEGTETGYDRFTVVALGERSATLATFAAQAADTRFTPIESRAFARNDRPAEQTTELPEPEPRSVAATRVGASVAVGLLGEEPPPPSAPATRVRQLVLQRFDGSPPQPSGYALRYRLPFARPVGPEKICAVASGERVIVVVAMPTTGGTEIGLLVARSGADGFTLELPYRSIAPPEASFVRQLACDVRGDRMIAVWTTPSRWGGAWLDPNDPSSPPDLDAGGRVTDEQELDLSVALVGDGTLALAGRGGLHLWEIRHRRSVDAIALPVVAPGQPWPSQAHTLALAPANEAGRIALAFDAQGRAGDADRDAFAVVVSVEAGDAMRVEVGPVAVSSRRGVPLQQPVVAVEHYRQQATDALRARFAFVGTTEVPGGTAVVVDREPVEDDGDETPSLTTTTLGATSRAANLRVAAAAATSAASHGLRILVDGPGEALLATLPVDGRPPTRVLTLYSESVASSDITSCESDLSIRGLTLARIFGTELAVWSVSCDTAAQRPVYVYLAQSDEWGAPLAPSERLVRGYVGAALESNQHLFSTTGATPLTAVLPAAAARVGNGLSVAFQQQSGSSTYAILLGRIECGP